MGAHRTPRGEKSTAQGHSKPVTYGGYEGTHRAQTEADTARRGPLASRLRIGGWLGGKK